MRAQITVEVEVEANYDLEPWDDRSGDMVVESVYLIDQQGEDPSRWSEAEDDDGNPVDLLPYLPPELLEGLAEQIKIRKYYMSDKEAAKAEEEPYRAR